MSSITFKTEILINCKGWRCRCDRSIWVPGQITLEEVLTVPQGFDADYGCELYSAHTSELVTPLDWFQCVDSWMCVDCYREMNKDRHKGRK